MLVAEVRESPGIWGPLPRLDSTKIWGLCFRKYRDVSLGNADVTIYTEPQGEPSSATSAPTQGDVIFKGRDVGQAHSVATTTLRSHVLPSQIFSLDVWKIEFATNWPFLEIFGKAGQQMTTARASFKKHWLMKQSCIDFIPQKSEINSASSTQERDSVILHLHRRPETPTWIPGSISHQERHDEVGEVLCFSEKNSHTIKHHQMLSSLRREAMKASLMTWSAQLKVMEPSLLLDQNQIQLTTLNPVLAWWALRHGYSPVEPNLHLILIMSHVKKLQIFVHMIFFSKVKSNFWVWNPNLCIQWFNEPPLITSLVRSWRQRTDTFEEQVKEHCLEWICKQTVQEHVATHDVAKQVSYIHIPYTPLKIPVSVWLNWHFDIILSHLCEIFAATTTQDDCLFVQLFHIFKKTHLLQYTRRQQRNNSTDVYVFHTFCDPSANVAREVFND